MKILDTINKIGGRKLLTIKKYSPEILIGTGIAGLVGAGVLGAKATLRLEEVLNDHKERMEIIHDAKESSEQLKAEGVEGVPDYKEEDFRKDQVGMYARTGLDFLKLYGPAFTLAAGSIFCILSGSNILRKRNVAIAAAYKVVEKGFSDYRGRVVEDLGKDKDLEYRYGLKSEKVKETITDENGKTKEVTKEVKTAMGLGEDYIHSEYARFFDSSCKEWEKNAEYNLMFLRNKQTWCNDRLRAQGYLFLNDVYDELGMPRSQAGQMVGWIMDPNDPDAGDDHFIDFGLYDNVQPKRDFVNGYEHTVLLDFNVDGVIYDKLP